MSVILVTDIGKFYNSNITEKCKVLLPNHCAALVTAPPTQKNKKRTSYKGPVFRVGGAVTGT